MTEHEGSEGPTPEITVTMSGELILNARAFAMLGESQRVTLLYSKSRHLMGIRGGGRFPVNRLTEGDQWQIGGRPFWKRIGMIITATTSYEAMRWPHVTREGIPLGGDALFIDISDLADESAAFRELFLETPAQYKRTVSSGEGSTNMPEQDWAAIYGPPATGAPYAVGETLIYDNCGTVENGKILYVAATNPRTGEADLHYVVSPAREGFPSPVWPHQIIAAM